VLTGEGFDCGDVDRLAISIPFSSGIPHALLADDVDDDKYDKRKMTAYLQTPKYLPVERRTDKKYRCLVGYLLQKS
jgi:hypothetical protein